MAIAEQVTGLYRARLSTATAGLLLRVRALWAQQFNPSDPNGSLAIIGAVVGSWTTGLQAAAVDETTTYLAALVAAGTGQPLAQVDPFAAPAGLVGSAANGTTVVGLTGQAPAVYWARRGVGQSESMAAAASLAWLNRVASSEPYRAANETTVRNADDDDRFTGRVVRITSAGACPFCVAIADRGYIPAHAGFAAHANCRCTPAPEISSHVRSRAGIRRGRQARAGQPLPPSRATGAARPAGSSAADTVPFTGFDQGAPKQRAHEVRSIIADNLTGIRSDVAGRLSEVRIASPSKYPRDKRVSNRALAWFTPAYNDMTIRQSTFAPKANDAVAQAQRASRSGTLTHFVPNAEPESGLQYVVTHEMGHFLDHQLTAQQRIELYRVAEDVAAAGDWKARQPATDRFASAARQISGYATTNRNEAIAEAWAEYKLAPNPRPVAKAIGDTLMRFLS